MSTERREGPPTDPEIIHDLLCGMQAAWIEWKHGGGAEEAMAWIENRLDGPGLIPEEDKPYATEAQLWFEANRSRPYPRCPCGRPSHILALTRGYCSWSCHDEHEPVARTPNQTTHGGTAT